MGQHPVQPRGSLYFHQPHLWLAGSPGQNSLPRPGAMILATFVKCLGEKNLQSKAIGIKRMGDACMNPFL